MDEQGIYCPQCRAYVHFWSLSEGGRPPAGSGVQGIVPGTAIEMPQSCKQCGHQSTYKTSDLRTRRVPTEPVMAAMLAPEVRRASTIDVQTALGDKKVSGPTS
jgi:hypothetical protein